MILFGCLRTWLNPTFAEGHILTRKFLAEHTLLPVTRGELVANDGGARDAELDTELLAGLRAILCSDDSDLFDERNLL
jgi:hypothetical protein